MRRDGNANGPVLLGKSLPRCACLLARSASPIRAQIDFVEKTHSIGAIESKSNSTCHQGWIDVVTDIQIRLAASDQNGWPTLDWNRWRGQLRN